MRSRRLLALVVAPLAIALVFVAAPYARALALIVRAADLGGRAEAVAAWYAHGVATRPRHTVPTRHGDVPARFYTPDTGIGRTVLLIPGIHSLGIDEPRLTALAADLAGAGIRVMTMALPDLQQYRITPRATDVIEDAVLWLSAQTPDRRVGLLGISFAGGLSVAAAGRPSVRDRIAFVVSVGGHGDLRRVMRYLATGEAPVAAGLKTHPPHDYGVAVILYGLAHRVVPPAQVDPLRENIATFLLASQLTRVSAAEAGTTFEKARQMQRTLPEPSATYMAHVNERAVGALGAVVAPHLEEMGVGDPALSPENASPPEAPVFLLHGTGDTVIPAAESARLAENLERRDADVRLLLSGVITHADADRAAGVAEIARLTAFWASVLRH
jgi:dienelactone hydrolase